MLSYFSVERRKYQKMRPPCLNGETLNILRVATHLGHPVAINNVNYIAIRNAKRDLIWRTNYVMAKFGFYSADVRAFMFRTYCTGYYGSPLWQLDSNDVKHLYVSWRNCIRTVWNIPVRSHCRLLNNLCEGYDIDLKLMSRFMSFSQSL